MALLGVVLLYWISFPFLPFLAIPHKAILIPAAVVIGEVLLLIAIALLGKEYWGRIRQWAANTMSPFRRRKRTDGRE